MDCFILGEWNRNMTLFIKDFLWLEMIHKFIKPKKIIVHCRVWVDVKDPQ